MKIIIDAFGGDNAPVEILQGAANAAGKMGLDLIVVGDENKIEDCLDKNSIDDTHLEIAHAPDVVAMEDEPMVAVRQKKDSSMMTGLRLLKEGYGDAFISAGNTGALLAGATLIVGRIPGVHRAALAPLLPSLEKKVLLIDSGANVECRPESYVDFAVMGACYMRLMQGVDNPEVGLINIGTEANKGTDKLIAANKLLSECSEINFIGNVEPRMVPLDGCDVAVCDGYTGNIVLKSFEGLGQYFVEAIRKIYLKNFKTRLSFSMVSKGIIDLRKSIDYRETGGAPFLGVRKPVIKAHGSSHADTFESAIRQAVRFVNAGIIDDLTEYYAKDKQNAEAADTTESEEE